MLDLFLFIHLYKLIVYSNSMKLIFKQISEPFCLNSTMSTTQPGEATLWTRFIQTSLVATKSSPAPILVNQTIFPCFSCLLSDYSQLVAYPETGTCSVVSPPGRITSILSHTCQQLHHTSASVLMM